MIVYILKWVAIPRRFRILIVRNCYKLRHFGGKTFRRKEDKKKAFYTYLYDDIQVNLEQTVPSFLEKKGDRGHKL